MKNIKKLLLSSLAVVALAGCGGKEETFKGHAEEPSKYGTYTCNVEVVTKGGKIVSVALDQNSNYLSSTWTEGKYNWDLAEADFLASFKGKTLEDVKACVGEDGKVVAGQPISAGATASSARVYAAVIAALSPEQTLTGYAEEPSKWGNYTCNVEVKVQGGYITSVTLDHENSNYLSSTWDAGKTLWDAAEADFLASFVGKTLVELKSSFDAEGNLVAGADAVAGATASTKRVYNAVINALEKL